jgi:TolB-like protein
MEMNARRAAERLCCKLKMSFKFPSFFVQTPVCAFEPREKWITQTKDIWGDVVQVRFGDCALDTERRELRRGTELVAVGPQVFDILVYLVENRERVVTKDNLLDAVWAKRIVSESTLTTHINAVRKAIGDNGNEQRLIRTIPRKGFRFIGNVEEEKGRTGEDSAGPESPGRRESAIRPLALPDRPSIAVLPFQNLSGDPEQEFLADGVVEDIIMALSRMRWLFVIARNSSFTYKGQAVDVRQVGRELGVRYVVEGSVRKAANRVRIAGQLIDAATGVNLWADRFEGALEDIFDLQDQIATEVVGAIAPTLERAEIDRAKRKPTENLDAYECYMRGIASLSHAPADRQANSNALDYFLRAIERDRDFAAAHGMAAWCYVWRKANGWITDRVKEYAEAERQARLAVSLGKEDAVALARGGHTLAFVVGELDDGKAFVDQALHIDPNFAVGWMLSGLICVYIGEPDTAIERIERALRLSPRDPFNFIGQTALAMAYFFSGQYRESLSWAEKALRDHPDYQLVLRVSVAANALAGYEHAAKQALQRLRRLDPSLRISNLKERFPLRRAQDVERFAAGLRKPGLPE